MDMKLTNLDSLVHWYAEKAFYLAIQCRGPKSQESKKANVFKHRALRLLKTAHGAAAMVKVPCPDINQAKMINTVIWLSLSEAKIYQNLNGIPQAEGRVENTLGKLRSAVKALQAQTEGFYFVTDAHGYHNKCSAETCQFCNWYYGEVISENKRNENGAKSRRENAEKEFNDAYWEKLMKKQATLFSIKKS